jgi:hypothetical protein
MFRVIYHKQFIFYFEEFENYNDAFEYFNTIHDLNKILCDINNNILAQNDNNIIIDELLKYNSQLLLNNEKKYHLAIYFVGHFLPNCDDLIQLQLNNYKNCSFDIFVITEHTRLYGRFISKNKTYNDTQIINENDIYNIFGKYKEFIRNITFVDNHKEELSQIINENRENYYKTYNTNLKRNREIEYFKLLLAKREKDIYKNNNNIKYDFIIKTRPDLILKNNLVFDNRFDKTLAKVYGRNNIFLFSCEETMDYLSNIILDYNHNINPECNITEYLNKNNIKILIHPKIIMERHWVYNIEKYFNYHLKHIDENKRIFWQIY